MREFEEAFEQAWCDINPTSQSAIKFAKWGYLQGLRRGVEIANANGRCESICHCPEEIAESIEAEISEVGK